MFAVEKRHTYPGAKWYPLEDEDGNVKVYTKDAADAIAARLAQYDPTRIQIRVVPVK